MSKELINKILEEVGLESISQEEGQFEQNYGNPAYGKSGKDIERPSPETDRYNKRYGT